MTTLSLEAIEERLAKAKEEAEFWEKAREILADPRLKAISTPEPSPSLNGLAVPRLTLPRAYGELQKIVYEVLPGPSVRIDQRFTTLQIVAALRARSYVFKAQDPQVAVNGALTALAEKGLAETSGRRGNARLWNKKGGKNQEAPEGAS